MLSATVQARTFELIQSGQRSIYFRKKPHWDSRFSQLPRSIILLSGRKARTYAIQQIIEHDTSYEVQLGDQITSFPKQEGLPNVNV